MLLVLVLWVKLVAVLALNSNGIVDHIFELLERSNGLL